MNIGSYVLLYLVVAFVIFLICRELMCWYFKVNETLGVLKEIRDHLTKVATKETRTPPRLLSERATSETHLPSHSTPNAVSEKSPVTSDPAAEGESPLTLAKSPSHEEDQQLIDKYKIIFDGENYHFKEYKYAKLTDAINYAKVQDMRR